jgi:signal transduction histidine kinase
MPIPPTRRSLRLRLAIWIAVVVILTAVVTLLVVRQGVQWAMFREVDEVLAEDISEIELALRETTAGDLDSVTHELDRKAIGHRRHGWFAILRDAAGRPVWASDKRHLAPPPPGASRDARVAGANDERRVEQAAPPNPHGIATIVVGEQLHLLRDKIARIDRLVLLTAGVVLMVAPLCGYWLAGRAARVVGEITRVASRLRPERLEERLPLRGTGDELDRLAVTINGLLDRIGLFLDQKRDVLANAAHELRTPLAAIRSSVEVALNGQRTSAEYEELLEDIIEQSSLLETLLNRLLLLTETERERLKTQREPVVFDSLVLNSIEMFQGVAESKGVSLAISRLDSAIVAGNRVHLWEVVNNLVDNALKYTPPGGRVEVSLTSDPARRETEVVVRDNGVGISEEDLPYVFDRFFRADRSRQRDTGPAGSGLGLSICKAVVEAHGGSVRCESRPQQGTTLTVRLPLAPQEAEPPPACLPADRSLQAGV